MQNLFSWDVGELGFPEPDLMIVHQVSPSHPRKPLELYGFPPWQIRLTEIRYANYFLCSYSSQLTDYIAPPLAILETVRCRNGGMLKILSFSMRLTSEKP